MELPTDPGERRAQVREIILRNEHPPGEVEKLYDGWEKYYDQVIPMRRTRTCSNADRCVTS